MQISNYQRQPCFFNLCLENYEIYLNYDNFKKWINLMEEKSKGSETIGKADYFQDKKFNNFCFEKVLF